MKRRAGWTGLRERTENYMGGSNLARGWKAGAQLSARLSVVGARQLALVVVRIAVNRTKAAIPYAVKRVRTSHRKNIEKKKRKKKTRANAERT